MIPLAVLAWLIGADGVLVDAVVAVVDKEVITHSELVMETRLALAEREGERAAAAELTPEVLVAFRDYVIDQLLVAAQARRLGSIDISQDEEEEAYRRFVQRFRSMNSYRAFLRRFGIRESAVRNILRRNLRNERFIAQRARLWLAGPASDGSAERYGEAVRRWLGELRESAEIRVINRYGDLERQ